jgi:hypothetical protein
MRPRVSRPLFLLWCLSALLLFGNGQSLAHRLNHVLHEAPAACEAVADCFLTDTNHQNQAQCLDLDQLGDTGGAPDLPATQADISGHACPQVAAKSWQKNTANTGFQARAPPHRPKP